MMNSVNYLLDDSGIIDLRNKDIKTPFLDTQKAYNERFKWQIINIVLPLVVLGVFGLLFTLSRKRKYT